ncbi:MAG TPA: protoporphyrinogen oxidase [Acidobacteriota bacterium]|jgi:oxygen-dependent protoporphyrinogen oxidase|nr:protoporphyrinogen oxidase [Acidobacteriota bacterium]
MIRRCGVAIIGGGISGLTTAYYLRRLRPQLSIALLEASRFWGGKIITERGDGRVIEWGPDSVIASKPHALELAGELGLGDQILSSNPENSRTLVFKRGKLIPIPEGFFLLAPRALRSLWKSDLFSLSAKWDILWERFRPAEKDLQDESIASFVRRRFGQEALELLGGPLLAGIYMGDPEKLSMRSTFPQLVEMEKKQGSVTAGIKARQPASAGGRSLFVSLRDGMESLVRAILANLDVALCPETPARRVERDAGSYRIRTGGDDILAERVVVCVDPENAFRLLEPLKRITELKEFSAVSSVVVVLVYGPDVALPNAYGVVIPRLENKQIAAISFSSKKFPGRVPAGESMLRVFLGGYDREAILEKDNSAILQIASEELREILGITSTPRFSRVIRWGRANPQYLIGHEEKMAYVRQALKSLPGVYLLGSSYGGVGVPDCVAQARQVAEEMLKGMV